MAKSFKQPTTKPEVQKRTSEKDFLDFLEQDNAPPQTSATDTTKQKHSNTVNTSNTSVTEPANTASENADVRQTFVIGKSYLDKLKDYVHTKRVSGQYEYTQKQALHEALDKLFEGVTIEVRPEHIRQQEEARKQRIRRGISPKPN